MTRDETPAPPFAHNADNQRGDGPPGAPIVNYRVREARILLMLQAINAPTKDNPVIQAIAAGVKADL